jgi:hypothetical protein
MRALSAMTLLSAMVMFALEAIANPVAINGRMRCGINDYAWPLSSDTAPFGTGNGTLEIVSDGHGHYTAGQMTENLADDTHAFGGDICTFDLVSGTYAQRPDGTTANTMMWKLRSGSDAHCGAIVTHEKNLGFVETARDFRSFQLTSTSYVLDDGRIAWVGASQLGVAIGACQPAGE